jgi:hypothetical protein
LGLQTGQITKKHFLALMFGVLLLVLIALTFVTFAFGAYTVFDHPNSDLVAQTIDTRQGATLSISASGFQNNSLRTIWIDPQFSSSNPSLLIEGSGFNLTSIRTDGGGNIEQNVTISYSQLRQIDSDGASSHKVWIIGVSNTVITSSGTFLNLTNDSKDNYTASTMGSPDTTNFFWILLAGVSSPISANLGQLFIVVWTLYLLFFASALNGPFRSLLGSLKDSASRGFEGLLGNSALVTFMVFPVAFWGSELLALLQQSVGVPTGSLPAADPLLQFVELSLAPLREEIGYRMIPIGIAAMLIILSRGQGKIKDALLSLWHPSRYLKKSQNPRSFGKERLTMYALIVVSALIFGAAHVLHGWDIGKLSQAAAVGLAFGILYYRYGFASAVLLHWQFDYVIGIYTETTNGLILNVFSYYAIMTEVAAAASTIVLIVLLVRSLRRLPSQDNWFR